MSVKHLLPADIEEGKARIHGNGFMQIELKDGSKIHFWWTGCPRQEVESMWHNHNHGFHSTVLYGGVCWAEGHVYPHKELGVFHRYRAIPLKGKDTRLERENDRVYLVGGWRTFELYKDSCYQWPGEANLYHQVRPTQSWTVTRVQRTNETTGVEPLVLCRAGVLPDNSFDRYAYPEACVEGLEHLRHLDI